MTNQYFNHTNPLDRHTLGRAELVNAIFEAVVAGFDKLPDPDLVAQARQTYAEDSGAANAYVVTLPRAPASYEAGLTVTMKAANANTGASTLNVNGLGVKEIRRFDGTPLLAADIAAGQLAVLGYDGVNFRLVGVHGGEVALARQWATSESTVADGFKGARGYALDAAGSAGSSAASANASAGSAAAALTSEQNAAAHFDTFRGVYYGALASDPTEDPNGDPPTGGDWYYNTTAKEVRIYDEDDAAWSGIGVGTLQTFVFTAAGGETSLSGLDDNGRALNYSPGFELVYLNGVRLVPGDDYVASNGTSITGLDPLSAADVVTMDAFTRFALTEERLPLVNNIAALRLKSGGAALDRVWLKCHTSDGDGGHGAFHWVSGAAPGTHTDNGGTIIVPTGGDGSAAWLRDYSGAVNAKWFGAGNGEDDCYSIVQPIIDWLHNLGGGTIYYPASVYNVRTALSFKSNVNHSGDGSATVIRVNSTPGVTSIFNQTSADVDNVTFCDIKFDGSINYPADSTVYKQTYANKNFAIRTSGIKATNITIKNCHFTEFSNGSIDINGFESANITIRNNRFYKGSYNWKVISLRLPSSVYTDEQRVANAIITDNHLDTNGPQYHYDASKEDWCGSADAIQIDSGKDCIVSDNLIIRSGAMGIRIEESLRVSVSNNKVVESGQDGISFYKDTIDCSCVGNTIVNWGRVPNAYCIRDFGGTYVVAREFPRAAGPTLPADPTASSWFEEWPYSLDNIDVTSIVAYSDTDYYTSPSVGILPCRGYAAISVTNSSQKISVVGNNALGNLSLDGGGKFIYAADFGFTPVHSVNDAVATSGLNCLVSGNGFVDTRVYRIYHPEYHDRINLRGLLGAAVYVGNRDTSSLIFAGNPRISQGGQLIATTRSDFLANSVNFPATQVPSANPNTLDDYEEGTFDTTMTASSGTITLSFVRLGYVKIGRLVTISGELVIGSLSSPTGSVFVGLPFANSTSSQRSARSAYYVHATSLTGTPTGACYAILESAASQVELVIRDDFATLGIASNLQVGSSFRFNFSYIAAA